MSHPWEFPCRGPKNVYGSSSTKVNIAAFAFYFVSTFASPGIARAQATGGSISGTVTREAGGTMPGVRVSLSDQASTVAREVTTDMDGVYNLPDVPPAVHAITLSPPRFVTQMWTGIVVGVGTDRVLNTVMRPGDPKTVVRTAAPPAPTRQAPAFRRGNANSPTGRETPLNGRDGAPPATLPARGPGVA